MGIARWSSRNLRPEMAALAGGNSGMTMLSGGGGVAAHKMRLRIQSPRWTGPDRSGWALPIKKLACVSTPALGVPERLMRAREVPVAVTPYNLARRALAYVKSPLMRVERGRLSTINLEKNIAVSCL